MKFSVGLAKRGCTTWHEGRQNHNPLQEKGRRKVLQQLQRHLPSQYHRQRFAKVILNRPQMLANVFTQSHIMASELRVQLYTWSSPFANSRRSTKTSTRLSTSSAETACSNSSQRLAAHHSCRASVIPHDMNGTVQFNGSFSDPFSIYSDVKQGCILAPIHFGIFFVVLLKHIFGTSAEGIYLCNRSDGRLFNLPPQSQDKGTQSSHQRHDVC